MTHTNSGSSWFHALRGARKGRDHRSARAARTIRRPAVEPLESRALLTGWTQLTNSAPVTNGIAEMMLLTDGTVIAQPFSTSGGQTNTWYRLTPDASGNYNDGTWSQIASMGTARLYYASNVLQNGNVFVQGGEYAGSASGGSFSNTGEIYNPTTNTWTPITPNFPQLQFGDDPSTLLPNGNILTGYISGPQTYIFNVTSNTWSATGSKNNSDESDEEGWVKLPDDSILSYDVFYNTGKVTGLAQRYIPSTGQWVNTGTVPVSLASSAQGYELGPGTLLPNGKVIYIGANAANSNTAIFDPTTDTTSGGGTWTAGPTIPGGYVADDAPGVLLPNGQYLFTADKGKFKVPAHVFDYDYNSNTITDITTTLPAALQSELSGSGSYVDSFLSLPNGQVLLSAASGGVLWDYTPAAGVNTISTPAISGFTPNGGNSYTLMGTTLTGSSQGASYGDDKEMDSNYPIVSLTDGSTVTYGRTTNWNKTGVGPTNGATSTNFTLPIALPSSPVVTPVTPTAVEGQALNNVPVATFTDPNGNQSISGYTATITWGDGTQSTGVVSGPVGNVYTVLGSHLYAQEGPETMSVQVTDAYTSLAVSASGVSSAPDYFATTTGGASFSVIDPAVIGSGGYTLNPTAGTSTGLIPLATFTDPGGTEAVSNYAATVTWGDGGSSLATITGPVNGVFTILGSYTYAATGQYTVSVMISHDTSTTTTVSDTAAVAAAVTGVSSSTSNGSYGVGKTISIQVAFNGVETVTGTPELALNSGGIAIYSGGGGTSTLTFLYTVGAGDSSTNLDYASTGALMLNGGTIMGPGGAANLTLTSPGTSGSLGASSNIVIDTVAPVVVSYNVLFGTGGVYNLIGSSRLDLPWTITGIQIVFSKPITAADLSSLTGLTTTGLTGLGTNTLTWAFNPISNGSFITSLLGAGADGITDAAGNYLAGGAGFSQNFKVLLGDVNGDGVVNSADLSAVNLAQSQPYNIFDDINGDGVIDINDVKAVRAKLGTHL